MIAELEVNWRQSLIPTWQEMFFSMKIQNPLVPFQWWTWQHLNIPALQKKSFQCSAFFMEHPGAWSQNGDKRKGIVEAPSRSWTQRRLILLFAFVLSCCLYISLPLPLHQTDYRQLEAGRQCHEIGSSSYFCHWMALPDLGGEGGICVCVELV